MRLAELTTTTMGMDSDDAERYSKAINASRELQETMIKWIDKRIHLLESNLHDIEKISAMPNAKEYMLSTLACIRELDKVKDLLI